MDDAAAPDAARADRLSRLSVFAAAAPGLSEVAAAEIAALGIRPDGVTSDGVEFTGDFESLARASVWLRTASRLLVRVASFRARTFSELERHAKRVDWSPYLGGRRAAFRITSSKSRLFHTGAIEQRLATLVGAVSSNTDEEQLFVVRGVRDEWTISADASGDHLHRRGYRQAVGKAPLRETLAAAAVYASGWDTRSPLLDPFCGSGTIPIEAAMIARGLPPGARRGFAFEHWRDTPAGIVDAVRAAAADDIVHDMPLIAGSDRDAGAVDAARANAGRAGLADAVRFESRSLSDLVPESSRGWIVTNPPYGVRVGDRRQLERLYRAFGALMRERFGGWTVAIVSADPRLDGVSGLPLAPALRTTNGGIRVRVMVGAVS